MPVHLDPPGLAPRLIDVIVCVGMYSMGGISSGNKYLSQPMFFNENLVLSGMFSYSQCWVTLMKHTCRYYTNSHWHPCVHHHAWSGWWSSQRISSRDPLLAFFDAFFQGVEYYDGDHLHQAFDNNCVAQMPVTMTSESLMSRWPWLKISHFLVNFSVWSDPVTGFVTWPSNTTGRVASTLNSGLGLFLRSLHIHLSGYDWMPRVWDVENVCPIWNLWAWLNFTFSPRKTLRTTHLRGPHQLSMLISTQFNTLANTHHLW